MAIPFDECVDLSPAFFRKRKGRAQYGGIWVGKRIFMVSPIQCKIIRDVVFRLLNEVAWFPFVRILSDFGKVFIVGGLPTLAFFAMNTKSFAKG